MRQLLHERCVCSALPSLAKQLPVGTTDPCNSTVCGRSGWALCHSVCPNLLASVILRKLYLDSLNRGGGGAVAQLTIINYSIFLSLLNLEQR